METRLKYICKFSKGFKQSDFVLLDSVVGVAAAATGDVTAEASPAAAAADLPALITACGVLLHVFSD